MRLAALYSGGKDSTFAMYTMTQMGHEIPYLVNIVPSDPASWIFHTPNLGLMPLMAEALGVELVSAPSDGTEEGDLASLEGALRGLDVEGIVTGAVWSDYQWSRINAVCEGLGLKVMSPMWRKDQRIIFDEICDSGVEAIIVGIYAEGLDGKWLGRRFGNDCKDELLALNNRFGVSIIGEGGEFETLTIDSPMHKKRIQIVSYEDRMERSAGTRTVTSAILTDKD